MWNPDPFENELLWFEKDYSIDKVKYEWSWLEIMYHIDEHAVTGGQLAVKTQGSPSAKTTG